MFVSEPAAADLLNRGGGGVCCSTSGPQDDMRRGRGRKGEMANVGNEG